MASEMFGGRRKEEMMVLRSISGNCRCVYPCSSFSCILSPSEIIHYPVADGIFMDDGSGSISTGVGNRGNNPRPEATPVRHRPLRVSDFDVLVGLKFAHLFTAVRRRHRQGGSVQFTMPPLLLTLLLRKVKNL